MTLASVGSGYRYYGLVARPGSLPAAAHLAGFASGLNIVYLSCAGFVLLLTPTGTLPSPRWRWWARIAAAAAAVFLLAQVVAPMPLYPEYPEIGSPIGLPALADPPLDAVVPVAGLVVLVGLVSGPGHWSGGSATPAGSNASSSAGWPGERPWPRWHCWSPLSTW